jgi:iron-sulfur cluster repair protein YtfE (RIC family)
MTIRTSIENAGKAMMTALGANTTPMEGDILETLKEEHDQVQSLLEKLVDSGNVRERKSLVNQIRKALVPHTKAEERVVYNPIIALNDKSAKIDGNEGYIEHALASETLAKLSKMTKPMSPEFSACAKVLRELVNHHVREEENNVWAQVREHFSAEDRARMNREFLATKKKVKV